MDEEAATEDTQINVTVSNLVQENGEEAFKDEGDTNLKLKEPVMLDDDNEQSSDGFELIEDLLNEMRKDENGNTLNVDSNQFNNEHVLKKNYSSSSILDQKANDSFHSNSTNRMTLPEAKSITRKDEDIVFYSKRKKKDLHKNSNFHSKDILKRTTSLRPRNAKVVNYKVDLSSEDDIEDNNEEVNDSDNVGEKNKYSKKKKSKGYSEETEEEEETETEYDDDEVEAEEGDEEEEEETEKEKLFLDADVDEDEEMKDVNERKKKDNSSKKRKKRTVSEDSKSEPSIFKVNDSEDEDSEKGKSSPDLSSFMFKNGKRNSNKREERKNASSSSINKQSSQTQSKKSKSEDYPTSIFPSEVERVISFKKSEKEGEDGDDNEKKEENTLYLVKFSDLSYRKIEWVAEKDLQREYPSKLQSFLRHKDEEFDFKDYLSVERVVSIEQHRKERLYLIKWKGLPYSECTWESIKDLKEKEDRVAISQYYAHVKQMAGKKTGNSESCEICFKDGRVLRDYQKDGLVWLERNFQNGVNSILGDEMGLGKTIQSVSMLENIRLKSGIQGPFLIIVPVTTLIHWQRELETIENMNCIVYHGSNESREVIRKYEFWKNKPKRIAKFNALVTSYEYFVKDLSYFKAFSWIYCIVDEAHRMKSKKTLASKALREIDIRKGGLLLLTGTPIQNSTKELHGLLHLLDPEEFKFEDEFLKKFGDMKDANQVKELQEILRPRLLRRMKEDVEKSIPKKEEVIIWVELTKEQRMYYKALYESKIYFLLNANSIKSTPNLINLAMELRKLCNHPFLCKGIEEDILNKKLNEENNNSNIEDIEKQMLWQSSGKMILIHKLLPKLKENGNRVLIFSQFVIMLNLLEDYMNSFNYSYERIDGNITGSERQEAIDRFNAKDSNAFVFLLSTKAGGLGITLTSADTCIIYDSDWNPQNDLQAMARCHRIGQKKDVKIYRLVTHNTYEQQLLQSASIKYGLDEAILGNNLGFNKKDSEKRKEIEGLLKNGAYEIFKEDGVEEANAFRSENIDEILQQRTQIRQIGGCENSTFSVVTFSTNDNNLDKDNADVAKDKKEGKEFWEELLPEASKNFSEKNFLPDHLPLVFEKRKRKRVNYKTSINSDSDSEKDKRRKDKNSKKKNEDGKEFDYEEEKDKEVEVDEEEVDEGEKEEVEREKEKEKEKEKGRGRGKEEEISNVWNKSEILRLYYKLFIFGTDKFEQIQEEANLKKKHLNEIKAISKVFINLCKYKIQNIDLKFFFELVLKKEDEKKEEKEKVGTNNTIQIEYNENENENDFFFNDLPLSVKNILKDESFTLRLLKNAKKNLELLEERKALHELFSNGKIDLLKKTFTKVPYLPEWWGEEEDAHLLLGIYKHGHKNYAKIKGDMTLCFHYNILYEENKNNIVDSEDDEITKKEKEEKMQSSEANKKSNDLPLGIRFHHLMKAVMKSMTRNSRFDLNQPQPSVWTEPPKEVKESQINAKSKESGHEMKGKKEAQWKREKESKETKREGERKTNKEKLLSKDTYESNPNPVRPSVFTPSSFPLHGIPAGESGGVEKGEAGRKETVGGDMRFRDANLGGWFGNSYGRIVDLAQEDEKEEEEKMGVKSISMIETLKRKASFPCAAGKNQNEKGDVCFGTNLNLGSEKAGSEASPKFDAKGSIRGRVCVQDAGEEFDESIDSKREETVGRPAREEKEWSPNRVETGKEKRTGSWNKVNDGQRVRMLPGMSMLDFLRAQSKRMKEGTNGNKSDCE